MEMQIDRGWRVLSYWKDRQIDGERQIASGYIWYTDIKRVIWKDRWINRKQVDKQK